MATTASRAPKLRNAVLAASVALATLGLGSAGSRAETIGGAGVTATYADPGASRRLDLSIGRSVVIDLPRDAKEVFVANPAIANAIVRSARKIFLIGVANGVTSVFMMDSAGQQIAALEVNVGRDLNVLRQTLRTAIPTGRIDIKPAGDSILLTGMVQSAGDAQQAVDIAKAFVGQSGGGQAGGSGGAGGASAAPTGGSGTGASGSVINALTIGGRDQVMLRVSVVEIARSAVKQLGINVTGNWNLLSTAAAGSALNPFGPAISAASSITTGVIGGLTGSGSSVSGQAGFGNGNAGIGGSLSALERAGVSRTLAEPTLVAISGETAAFQAGGEIPIVINSCTASGSSTICTPTVTYKPYGVLLRFTPVVLSEGRISLRVATEVSEIDRENRDTVTNSPAFRTRKSDTTIELPSGGSMVTAGLISSQSTQTINGTPGLINLPILGALFRSRDFQRRDSELMIMVTPYMAKPMEPAQAVRPDDGFVDSSDPQAVLLGRLNKIYGSAGPKAAKATGRFGFITD